VPRVGLDLTIVLQTAAELADQHGLEQVTLAMLAKKLGIRPPSIYNHVDGLGDLRKKLAIYGLKQLTVQMMHAAAGRAKEDAIYAIGEAYVTFARIHPGLYEACLWAPAPGDEEYKRAASELVDLVIRVVHSFGLKEEEALHAVRGFRSLLHGFASLEQKGGFGLPLDLDDTLRFILKIFLAGLNSRKENQNS
jgi:AcrR family transcriptional regulator